MASQDLDFQIQYKNDVKEHPDNPEPGDYDRPDNIYRKRDKIAQTHHPRRIILKASLFFHLKKVAGAGLS